MDRSGKRGSGGAGFRSLERYSGRNLSLLSMPVHLTSWILSVVAVSTGAMAALLWVLGIEGKRPAQQSMSADLLFDLLSTVLAVSAALGAVVALVVAYRKQRVAEMAAHRDEVKLFSERFTAACALFGQNNPAVHFGAVNSITALADETPDRELRQMCVDQLCSYVRIPLPADPEEPGNETVGAERRTHDQSKAELEGFREVRRKVLRTIADRLRCEDGSEPKWAGRLEFDLSGTVIENAKFDEMKIAPGCEIYFTESQFIGDKADFFGIKLEGGTIGFMGCNFKVDKVNFTGNMNLGIFDLTGAGFWGSQVAFREFKWNDGDFRKESLRGNLEDIQFPELRPTNASSQSPSRQSGRP